MDRSLETVLQRQSGSGVVIMNPLARTENYYEEPNSGILKAPYNIIKIMSNQMRHHPHTETLSYLRHCQGVEYSSDGDMLEYADERNITAWSHERAQLLIRFRQDALDFARKNADYVFFLDVDNYLLEPDTLKALISMKKLIVAPLLVFSQRDHEIASNFKVNKEKDPTSNGSYFESYGTRLYRRRFRGCFVVDILTEAYLIHSKDPAAAKLTFHPDQIGLSGHRFDFFALAASVRAAGEAMYLLNDRIYGMLGAFRYSDAIAANTLRYKVELLQYQCTESVLVFSPGLRASPVLKHSTYPKKTKMMFDKIYFINLDRRRERLEIMFRLADILGLDVERWPAVDGRSLNASYLKELGITQAPLYMSPFDGLPMTMGEVGCFLSHYSIWQKVVDEAFESVLILEDDARFGPAFKYRVEEFFQTLEKEKIQYDLAYLGRIYENDPLLKWQVCRELPVNGLPNVMKPSYSFWAIAYVLTQSGARKLLAGKPLSNLLPVDEYLPAMFRCSPRFAAQKFDTLYGARDLEAVSINPVIVEPQERNVRLGSDTTFDTDFSRSPAAFGTAQKKDEL